jgi:hypothetical protein
MLTETRPVNSERTDGLQRPKIGFSRVSEVNSTPPKPFAIERKFGVGAELSGVRNRKMAEGDEPGSNILSQDFETLRIASPRLHASCSGSRGFI